MYLRHLYIALAVICVFPARSIGQSRPLNDNFANRTVLTGSSFSVAGTLAGATLESAEINGSVPPGAQSSGGSVWWTWTAPQSSTVVMFVQRDFASVSGSNTFLAVYSGSALTNLTEITYTTFDAPRGRYATFPATAGATFQIRVAGSWNQPFNLLLTLTNPPVFVVQPTDCLASPHGSAFFGAIASGPIPTIGYRAAAAYQWKFNGAPIPGQTCPSLLVHDVGTNQAGSYSVIASNAGGITESASVMLNLADTNPVPRVTALPPSNSTNVSFALSGEIGRWYAIESCSNLLNWGTDHANKIWSTNTVWVEAINATGLLSVRRLGPAHFVRASLNVPTDVCVGQLKQMVWAEYVFAIEKQMSRFSSVTLSDIKPYVPLGPFGNIQACPEGGTYWAPATVVDPITCTVTTRGHTLGVSP